MSKFVGQGYQTQRTQTQLLQRNIFRHPQLIQNDPKKTLFNYARTRDVGTQSDYREQEVQTDPYTPPYVIPEGQPEPDILALLPFTYGHGLPVGAHEISMIEKAQMRREKEHALPPPSDPKAFKERVRFFAQCELEDWMEREDEVRRVQENRIKLLKDALELRDKRRTGVMESRLEEVKTRKYNEKEAESQRNERARVKGLRHFTEEVKNPPELKERKRDIIENYFQFKSKTYAPLPREGQVGERATSTIIVSNVYNETLEGLEVLERDLPLGLLKKPARVPVKAKPKTTTERKQRVVDAQIREIEASMRARKALAGGVKRDEDDEGSELLKPTKKKKEKFIPNRPKTPSIDAEKDREGDEDANDAVFQGALLLQRLTRGRAVQMMMMEGMQKRMHLIQELRLEERLREVSEDAEAEEQEDLAERLAEQERQIAEQLTASVAGDVVGQALHTLSTELVLFREERRIAAMVQMAERARRLKEAKESGKRQEEEERRGREDERMRQIMHTQHRTVDAFLESVIADSCSAAAKKSAVLEARVLAGRLGDVLYEVERRQPEVIIRDLVSSFLFPEVERGLLRERIKRDQRRFIETAKTQLAQAVDTAAQAVEKKK